MFAKTFLDRVSFKFVNVKNGWGRITNLSDYYRWKVQLPDGNYVFAGKDLVPCAEECKEFPEVGFEFKKEGEISWPDLKGLGGVVARFAAKEPGRYAINGVFVSPSTVAATDSRALAIIGDSANMEEGVIPPGNIAAYVLQTFSKVELGDNGALRFASETEELITLRIEGLYPRYPFVFKDLDLQPGRVFDVATCTKDAAKAKQAHKAGGVMPEGFGAVDKNIYTKPEKYMCDGEVKPAFLRVVIMPVKGEDDNEPLGFNVEYLKKLAVKGRQCSLCLAYEKHRPSILQLGGGA